MAEPQHESKGLTRLCSMDSHAIPRLIHALTSCVLLCLSCVSVARCFSSAPPAVRQVEMTYPMQESVSGGVLSIVSNGVGVIFLFVAPSLSGPAMNATMVLTIAAAAVAVPLVADRYHRADEEEKVNKGEATRAMGASDTSGGAMTGHSVNRSGRAGSVGVVEHFAAVSSHGGVSEMDDVHEMPVTRTMTPLEATGPDNYGSANWSGM